MTNVSNLIIKDFRNSSETLETYHLKKEKKTNKKNFQIQLCIRSLYLTQMTAKLLIFT